MNLDCGIRKSSSRAVVTFIGLAITSFAALAGVQTPSAPSAASRQSKTDQGNANELPGIGSTLNHHMTAQTEKLFNSAIEMIRVYDFSAAVSLLRKAVALAPGDATLHHYLGYALWRTDKLETAKEEFATAHRLDPANVYTTYFLGIIAYSQGDLKQAQHLFEGLIECGHPINDTYRRLSLVYEDQGDLSKAETIAQEALHRAPWDGSLHYLLAKIYQRMGRTAEAEQEFETSTRLKNLGHETIQELLEFSEAIRTKQADKAMELREELIGQASRNPITLKTIGILLAQAHLFSESLQPFQMAADLEPQSFEAQFNVGLTLARLGQDSQAEAYIRKALAIQSDLFEANSTLAALLINQGRTQEAIERLQTAHRVSPNNADVLALLGQQYLTVHDSQKSIQALVAACKLKPDNPAIRYLMIDAYYQAQEFDQALAAAQAAEKLFPSDARLCYESSLQLAAVGRHREAGESAQKAIRIDPKLVPAYDLLGKIQLHNGEAQLALRTYQKAKSLAPQDVQAWVGISQCLARLNRYQDALAELQEAVKTHPESADLYYALAQVYVRLGNKEEAARASEMFNRLHVNE